MPSAGGTHTNTFSRDRTVVPMQNDGDHGQDRQRSHNCYERAPSLASIEISHMWCVTPHMKSRFPA